MTFLQHGIDALSLGGLYALAALGIALVFGLMRLVNFAHAQIIVVGAFGLWYLRAGWHQSWPVVIIGLLILVVVLALLMERLAFRPLRNASPAILLASSFALSVLVQNVLLLIVGPRFRSVDVPRLFSGTIKLGNLSVSRPSLLTLVTSVVIIFCLGAFLKKTSIGIQMLAAAEDFNMARMVGVRANRVIAWAFGISGLLAGVLSFFLVAQQGIISGSMGLPPLLVAFVAVVIGGIGSLGGAVIGGLLLGVMTTVLQVGLPLGFVPFRDAFLYGLVIVILLIRPQGIMGSRALEGRV